MSQLNFDMPEQPDNVVTISVVEVASSFNISVATFKEMLAQIGWEVMMSEAERLAADECFEKKYTPAEVRALLSGGLTPPMSWRHVIAAAKSELPALDKIKPRDPAERLSGYLYVLYDVESKTCKIGQTKKDSRQRQRSQMGSHGNVLINVLNAKVANRVASESRVHQHFAEFRRGGEWFSVDLMDVVTFIQGHIEYMEMDFENTAQVLKHVLSLRSGDPATPKSGSAR